MEDFATKNMLVYINHTEIKNNIKSLPYRKSPGADQITNQMLKKLPNKPITFLTNLTQTPNIVKFDNEPIGWKSSVKYSRVILDKILNWWPHISAKLQQAYQRLGVLFPILNRKSIISKKYTLNMYKQILRPLILYASPILDSCANTLHNDFKIPTIDEHINHIANRFFQSLKNSNGAAHYNLIVSPPKIRRLKRGRPHDRIK
ncbi:Uncharacterized protein FWK35_00020101 [Aphis craccivora]|uniref:RNA-directed DNA polymerase from mobile element jockey n=1 Tax=Aphis craccivora TaxID=307492 RepID=A0A6G0Y6D0_APHCR|nr:Uncharacterized protein FWK35_00020101 [Aphis craccivora]